MGLSQFLTLAALALSVQALPLSILSGGIPSSSQTAAVIDTTPTAIFSTLLPIPNNSLITATVALSSTATGVSTNATSTLASATATDSSVESLTTDGFASSTDTSVLSASTTDSAALNATDTFESVIASATDSSALPTTTDDSASDATSTATSTAQATATSTSISFDIPDVPPACLALASGGALPTSSVFTSSSASSTLSTTSASSGSLSATSDTVSSTAAGNATITPTATANATSSALPTGAAGNATLVRRLAQQDLPAVAQSWQDLCLVSGGDIFTNEPCVQLAGVDGINALLADADPCAQQDNADAMIDFARSAGVTNTDALIANAVAYASHPRNTENINGVVPSTPFCQRAPKNSELAGVVRPQLDGVNVGIFGSVDLGLFAFGADGTCPLGKTADINTCSCS